MNFFCVIDISQVFKILKICEVKGEHSMTSPHESVLAKEVCDYFQHSRIRVFVDGTLGAGGHSALLLESHPEIELLIGIDQDPEALKIAQEYLSPWRSKIQLHLSNFSRFYEILDRLQIEKIDGMLLDLGVSSMQLDRPEKGFSFRFDGPLDMRMDPSNPLTAEKIINEMEERDLGVLFRDYGEEKQWRRAAHAIVIARQKAPITTTAQLVNVLYPVLERGAKRGIHPLTLIFQALRIKVNGELEALESTLPFAIERLRVGGRLAVISFHSLEDRIVKNGFAYEASDKVTTTGGWGGVFLSKESRVEKVTKKPITASEEELRFNPRSRSAKLRVVERL
jgi:16S rRNA (cytosine1402-N4)-methyltransferase